MYAKTTKDFADLIKKYRFTRYYVINGCWEGEVIELTDEHFTISTGRGDIKYPIGDYGFEIEFSIMDNVYRKLGNFTLNELRDMCVHCNKCNVCSKGLTGCDLSKFIHNLFKTPLVMVNLDKEYEIY